MKKIIPSQVGDGATCLYIHWFSCAARKRSMTSPPNTGSEPEKQAATGPQSKKGLTQAPEAGTQSQVRQGQDTAFPNKRSGICAYTAYCPWPGSCKQIR